MLPKAIYSVNTIPIKIIMLYFTELEQTFPKFIWKPLSPHIATTILRKKNKVGGITLPNIKLYYKAIGIKTAWHWHKNRHIDQWNRIESPEITPYLYIQLIFNRRNKHIQWAKDGVEKIGQICAKNETRPPSYTTHKNSKWIKTLNVRPKTIKIIEENTGSKISDVAHRNILLDISPQARETKGKKNQMGLH